MKDGEGRREGCSVVGLLMTCFHDMFVRQSGLRRAQGVHIPDMPVVRCVIFINLANFQCKTYFHDMFVH